MKIKKFEAQTEQEAIEMVKEELGADAIVLNIKKTQPKGIFAIFRKPVVEITAAYDERKVNENVTEDVKSTAKHQEKSKKENKKVSKKEGKKETGDSKTEDSTESEIKEAKSDTETDSAEFATMLKDITISEQQVKIRDLENQIQSSEQILSKMSRQLISSVQKAKYGARKYNAPIVQMFYDTLIEYGVIPEICEYILDEIDMVSDIDEVDINILVKIVYNTIISMLQGNEPPEPERIDKKFSKASIYAFIGSTGVGKTTTIAKLAAEYMINRGLNIGLITADTYRIAAVEQLKLYADILGVEVCVVYNSNDLNEYIDMLGGINDVILIDTAGRSHKNTEAIHDLEELISSVEDCQVFLVLSLTTKYDDLISIIETYAKIADFRIVFTKWDETFQIGSILNIVYKTGKKIAYITNGQNVPQDFDILRPEMIAKSLLGLSDIQN